MNHIQKTVAGYRLTRLIGMGGMAEVYEGDSLENPGEKAAIKVLLEEFRNDYEVNRRFDREPRIMQKLDNEYIIKVYGVDSIDGLPVIIMEYLDGLDLKSILSKSGKIEIDVIGVKQ